MGEPARKLEDIEPDIRPNLRVIQGGGQSTPERASLKVLNNLESNPEKPSTGSIDEQESNGSNVIAGPWANKVSGIAPDKSKSSGRFKFAKKKGPLMAIILTVVGGGFGIGALLSPALLPMSILGNLLNKFNTGEISATVRANKLIVSKMSENATSGSCNIIKIACRFTKPSNRFLSQLEKNGIKSLDKEGNVIEKKLIFPNTRPAKYKFTNSAGESVEVGAKDLYSTLLNNNEFRAAFHSASQTRFMSLMDSIANSIKLKFGLSFNDKLSGVKDESGVISEVDNNIKVDDAAAKAAANTEGKAASTVAKEEADVIDNIITEEADNSVAKLAKAGKGDAIGLIAGGVCLLTDVPGLIISANRSFQMGQLISYSVTFLSAFSAIKAGDATPQEVSAIGNVLTKVVNGKSAMDSFGMKYSITGQTKPDSTSYKKFAPGSGVLKSLGGINAITSSAAKKATCNVITDPKTGAAINVALAANTADTLGASLVLAVVNVGLGYILSYIAEKTLPPLINAALAHIPLQSVLQSFFGDLTKNLSGEDIGDAITSGASQLMGQTANAGGNMPLTVTQAVAYENTTKQIQLAYAEEDRATKSPFDITSPNTMLGSIVQSLAPYYAKIKFNTSSMMSNLAVIGNMITSSFGIAMQPLTANAASTDSSQYQLCDDPSIKDSDVAAGPYCNIIYGIPTDYLDEDPVTVVNNLIASGDINEDTGDPIPDKGLESWITLCTGGRADEASNCKITNKTKAEYAIYTIDHRIQKSMDDATQ